MTEPTAEELTAIAAADAIDSEPEPFLPRADWSYDSGAYETLAGDLIDAYEWAGINAKVIA